MDGFHEAPLSVLLHHGIASGRSRRQWQVPAYRLQSLNFLFERVNLDPERIRWMLRALLHVRTSLGLLSRQGTGIKLLAAIATSCLSQSDKTGHRSGREHSASVCRRNDSQVGRSRTSRVLALACLAVVYSKTLIDAVIGWC